MAPQPGFEPGTLRLTGGKRNVSRSLRRLCGTLPDPAPSLRESDDFCPSLCAGACWRLPVFGAPKGQEKGNAAAANSSPAQTASRPFGRSRSGGHSNTALDTGRRRIAPLHEDLALGSEQRPHFDRPLGTCRWRPKESQAAPATLFGYAVFRGPSLLPLPVVARAHDQGSRLASADHAPSVRRAPRIFIAAARRRSARNVWTGC